jgi:hypothetical protein
MRDTEVWLYRGAWQEWGPEEIEMAVPLAPSEVDAQASGDLQAREPEGQRALPGPDRYARVLAAGRGPQPGDRGGLRRSGPPRVPGDRGVRAGTSGQAPQKGLTEIWGRTRTEVCWGSARGRCAPSRPRTWSRRSRDRVRRGAARARPDPPGRVGRGRDIRPLGNAGIRVVSGMMEMKGEDYSSIEAIARTGGVRPDETWAENARAGERLAEIAGRRGHPARDVPRGVPAARRGRPRAASHARKAPRTRRLLLRLRHPCRPRDRAGGRRHAAPASSMISRDAAWA